MSKGNDELHKCVNSSCIRKRQSKDYVILQFRSYFSCLWIVLAVDGQGGQQTPVLFWSWPMTGCMTFTSHLMSLSLFAKWAWKALLPCLSQTVASSGKVNGAVRQSGLLVALCQITVHPVVHNMNKAKRDDEWCLVLTRGIREIFVTFHLFVLMRMWSSRSNIFFLKLYISWINLSRLFS